MKPEELLADAIDRAAARGDLVEDQLLYLGRYSHDGAVYRACALGFAAVGSGLPVKGHYSRREIVDHIQAITGASRQLLWSIEEQHINDVPVKKIAKNLRLSVMPWWKRVFHQFAVA